MEDDALKIYVCNCTSHPFNLWRPVSSVVTEKKKDHRVLTEPFSYNRANMVIIFHQFDWIECTCWYICGFTYLRKYPSCSFRINAIFYARTFSFLVKSITHNEPMVAQGVLFLEAVLQIHILEKNSFHVFYNISPSARTVVWLI